MVTGMAITHHGTSYCLSNQFTVQEVNSKVRMHSKTHRAYNFFFMRSTSPFIGNNIGGCKTFKFEFVGEFESNQQIEAVGTGVPDCPKYP